MARWVIPDLMPTCSPIPHQMSSPLAPEALNLLYIIYPTYFPWIPLFWFITGSQAHIPTLLLPHISVLLLRAIYICLFCWNSVYPFLESIQKAHFIFPAPGIPHSIPPAPSPPHHFSFLSKLHMYLPVPLDTTMYIHDFWPWMTAIWPLFYAVISCQGCGDDSLICIGSTGPTRPPKSVQIFVYVLQYTTNISYIVGKH